MPQHSDHILPPPTSPDLHDRPRVAILFDLRFCFFRQVGIGAMTYTTSRRPWRLDMGGLPRRPQELERRLSNVDGAIVNLCDSDMYNVAAAAGIPVVNISGHLPWENVPRVTVDNVEVGRVGARYLAGLGVRHVAYCARQGHQFALRRRGLEEIARARGLDCRFLDADHEETADGTIAGLTQMLAELPRPAGVLAGDDHTAIRVLEAAADAGIDVPDDLAVVGVNNDIFCEACQPSLSSVDPAGQRVGFEAARTLDGLLHSRPPQLPVLVKPGGVVPRRSSGMLAIDDPMVRKAVHFIHEQACRGITGEDVLAHVCVSRPTLEKRFRKWMPHSVREEIRHQQFRQARRLLAETDLRIADIAQNAGFRYFTRFTELFTKAFGESPSAFRRRFRRG